MCRNFVTKAPRVVYANYLDGKARQSFASELQSLAQLLHAGNNVDLEELSSRVSDLIGQCQTKKDYIKVIDLVLACYAQEFKLDIGQAETRAYEKALKKRVFRKIIPKVYEEHSRQPVDERKILFLNKRKGLTPSLQCSYIFDRLETDPRYDTGIHSLFLGKVPVSETCFNAIQFVKDFATAKALFLYAGDWGILSHVEVRDESKVIQLWHGCGVFKKLDFSLRPKHKRSKVKFPRHTNYTCVAVPSLEQKWVFEEFMNISKDSDIIQPLGISYTDVYFDEDYRKRAYEKLYSAIPEAREKKVILYAPTYRGKLLKRRIPDRLDIDVLAQDLKDDYILIIKHHRTGEGKQKIPKEHRDSFAYDFTRSHKAGMEINEFMMVADIMITDYSSVAFEYALLERPLIFFAYDLDEYLDERGLYYEFDEITPGPIVTTNSEIVDYIKSIELGFDADKIVNFKKKYLSACDGQSTERVLKLLE